jgi:membrane protein implicated in regulation of membrane protease activity
MDAWVIWILVAVAFGVGEVLTTTFVLAPFSVGALVAALVAAIGGGAVGSWATFIIVSLLMLWVVRPIARSHMRTPAQLRTGTAALVGATAVVIDRVDRDGGTVRLAGEIWSARSYDEDLAFEPGDRVEVLKIDGATALVHE